MKKVYIISFTSGFSVNVIFVALSFIFSEKSFAFINSFLLNAIESFTEKQGAIIHFSFLELLKLGLPYLIVSLAFGGVILFLSSSLRSSIKIKSNTIFLLIGINILGFYVGFALVGLALLSVGVVAWSNALH